jgi:hypothetical protein
MKDQNKQQRGAQQGNVHPDADRGEQHKGSTLKESEETRQLRQGVANEEDAEFPETGETENAEEGSGSREEAADADTLGNP